MADLTHDTAEDGFHEIQLSGKQIAFLFMAMTVVLVATFLCGVTVGRSVSAERGDEVSDSAVAGADSTPEVELAAPLSAEPPSPPPDDELSYDERLRGGATPQRSPQPAQQAAAPLPPPVAAPEPASKTEIPDVPTSGQKGTWVVQVTALQNRPAAAGLVQSLIGKGYPAFLEMPAPGAPAIYRVRIGRYRERREADQIARRLEKEEQFSPVVTR